MHFEKSADTKVIQSVLAEANVGDTVTYETLSKAIGRDVRVHAINAMRSARLALLNEKKYVFGVEHNVGLVRLDDSQIVDSAESDRRKMKRAANRSMRKLEVVDFEKLPDEKKKQHTVAAAQMGAIAMFAAKSATKKIESKVDSTKQVLPIGETLRLFQ